MSLRARLLLSYGLVVVTCLAVIGLALLLLLREAPTQKRLTTARLTIEAGVVQRLIRIPLAKQPRARADYAAFAEFRR